MPRLPDNAIVPRVERGTVYAILVGNSKFTYRNLERILWHIGVAAECGKESGLLSEQDYDRLLRTKFIKDSDLPWQYVTEEGVRIKISKHPIID